MFVITARLMPQVSECVKERVAGVLMEARPLKSPASSSGQHQLPTSAGMEHSSVATATHAEAPSPSGRGADAPASSAGGCSQSTHSSSSPTPAAGGLIPAEPARARVRLGVWRGGRLWPAG